MRVYATSNAFKNALEAGLRQACGGGPGLTRARQVLVYERFLARMVAEFGASLTLKGGLALELRLTRARTTKDVDLRVEGSAGSTILRRLQTAAVLDLGDWMTFEVVPNTDHPKILAEGLVYEGFRFQAKCLVGGKLYGSPFGVDVAVADPMWGTPDVVEAINRLAFVGAPATQVPLLRREAHVAEKLHAYTQPRPTPNSRVKDLPDLALLATSGTFDAGDLLAALHHTFDARRTHDLPGAFPEPIAGWANAYEQMAQANDLPWTSLDAVAAAVRAFLDPVLAGAHEVQWDPDAWSWFTAR